MCPHNSFARDLQARPGAGPILCYVTDRRSLRVAPQANLFQALIEKIGQVAAAGVDWIQLREKDLSGKDSAALTHDALDQVSNQTPQENAAASVYARIVVNDRLDIALAERAGGVHLGENSLPPEEAKRLLLAWPPAEKTSREFLIGVSCHSLEAAQSAASAGADYIFYGPVFATPSKVGYGSPQGLDHLAEVSGAVSVPVLAIGGITLDNAASCISVGAAGIAAIRLFQDSPHPAELVQKLRRRPG